MVDFTFGKANELGLSLGVRVGSVSADGTLSYELALKNEGAEQAEVVLFKDTEAMYRTLLVTVGKDGKQTKNGAIKPEMATLMGRKIVAKVDPGTTVERQGASLRVDGTVESVFVELGDLRSPLIPLARA